MISTFVASVFLGMKQNKARRILARIKKNSVDNYNKIIDLLESSRFLKEKKDLMQNKNEIENCIKSDIYSFHCSESDINTLCYLCVPSLR